MRSSPRLARPFRFGWFVLPVLWSACSGGSGETGGGSHDGGELDGGNACQPDPCAALPGTQCRLGRCVAGTLSVTVDSHTETLSGTYTYVATGKAPLQISAALDSYGGAQATLKLAGATDQVTVKLVDASNVQMVWAGQTITGNGVLTATAATALAQFAATPLAEAVALAALEIGCGSQADPMQLAAVLAPWQLVLKYVQVDRVERAKAYAAATSCAYFANPSPGVAPAPGLLQLGFEDPVPNVFGIFPLDATGAVEVGASGAVVKATGSLSGPCGALCRGACGPDCTTNNCTFKGTGQCETDATGKRTGNWITATVYNCGTGQGCREHDDCYDACNDTRCGTWAAATCRRGCDLDTARKFPAQAPYWARGLGTFDGRLDFSYADPPRYDPVLCPLQSVALDASLDAPADARPADAPADVRVADLPPASPDVAPDLRVADAAPDAASPTDVPINNVWRMTKFESTFQGNSDACYTLTSASDGKAVFSGDCQYYDGQYFAETNTVTWTPPPAQLSLPTYAPSSTVWWQGTFTGSTVLSIPNAYHPPTIGLDITAVQSSHPADSYVNARVASADMAPTASGSFSATNNGTFVPDPHTGTPTLDPSPVVVTAWFSGKGAAMGLYNLYLKYTYTRQ